MSCIYKYKNKEYSEQEILDLLKQENKSFWNRLTRTGLGLLTPETREAILNEASKKYGIARGESKTTTKYSQVQQNEINYVLKAVDILQSTKGDEIFRKGDKNNWNIDKILQELQIPKDQQDLIKSFNTRNREEIITNLLAGYSYTVEINTSKEEILKAGNVTFNNLTNDSIKKIIDVETSYNVSNTKDNVGKYYIEYFDNNNQSAFNIYEKYEDAVKDIETKGAKNNSQYYSNLTVPGGTNYTENEIVTPAITPSIKGHAQFATDKGIGWFRSDEKGVGGEQYTRSYWDSERNEEVFINDFDSTGIKPTKTRRILEVQSDLFQKGRDKENLDKTDEGFDVDNNGNKFEQFTIDGVKYVGLNGHYSLEDSNDPFENVEKTISKEEFLNKFKEYRKNNPIDNTKNQFLQLLNKNNNWVTFFVKSIVQDSAKKG